MINQLINVKNGSMLHAEVKINTEPSTKLEDIKRI